MKYRITAGRWDIAPHEIGKFEAATDEEARRKFEQVKSNQAYAWDCLNLLRIDQVEKTSLLETYNHEELLS